jgi:diaminopimelate decarboxylase
LSTVEKLGMPETLSFRINPGIGGDGAMETNVMAGPYAKYGVPFEKAPEAYKRAQEMGVKHFGIHMMTGSNVVGEEYFQKVTEKLFEIIADIKEKTGIEIEFMNIGGGFYVPYKPEEQTLDIEKAAAGVRAAFDTQCEKFGLKEPRLIAEPARYICADAGWLVGKVTVIKDSYKKFVGVDASTNDLPRPWAYGAYHHVSVVPSDVTLSSVEGSKSDQTELVSIADSICENKGQLARDRELPKCTVGDIVVIHTAGCHSFVMGHNYNGKLRHAEYLIQSDGTLRKIRRAETFEDLFRTIVLS